MTEEQEEEEEEEEEDENKRIRPRERALGQKLPTLNSERRAGLHVNTGLPFSVRCFDF